MTRSKIDAWTWFCDQCGTGSGDLAHEQSGPRGLPTPDEMRARGWYIAPKWGDLCPECVQANSIAKGDQS
jgi:hypothetical protein